MSIKMPKQNDAYIDLYKQPRSLQYPKDIVDLHRAILCQVLRLPGLISC